MTTAAFDPPPHPYDRLNKLKGVCEAHAGGIVNLSVGSPSDPPPAAVTAALGGSNTERGYPASNGSPEFRQAAANWMNTFEGVDVGSDDVRATIGSKEFVAGVPHWLKLRRPDLEVILYPETSYPSYAMGATLGGCRPVAVPMDENWRMDLSAISPEDAERALCIWVNSPGNPAGGLEDLDATAAWGRERGVPVISDECYISFTWNGPGRSILSNGTDGLIAVHSLSKRSNLAGARAGFYAGDADLLHYLSEVRKHAGFMPPGPSQAAAVVALGDEVEVLVQRERYMERMEFMQEILAEIGVKVDLPEGGFYLWAPAPNGDAWAFVERLAQDLGILVAPGEFYGDAAPGYVRLVMVTPMESLELVKSRL